MGKNIEQLFLEATYPDPVVSYKGQRLVRLDHLPVRDGEKIKIVFEHVGSEWSQAVRLRSDAPLEIDGEHSRSFTLWSNAAPPEIICICRSEKGEIVVYNAWDAGKGTTEAWVGHAAMIVEELSNGRRYRCNDSHRDDDFDDLIFRIERVAE